MTRDIQINGKIIRINQSRLVELFMELVEIDCLSLNEGNMAIRISEIAKAEGLKVQVDDSAEKTGGQTGNIIITLEGDPDLMPLFFSAHMDTVVPGISKKAVIKGEYIVSQNDTVLGADDMAGVACAFEAVRTVRESGIKHGNIQLIFSVAEEIGLVGAKNMDLSMIKANVGYVLDHHGSPGHIAICAPSQDKIDITIEGKPAHAGIEPENGISAIEVFAHAVAVMKLGRIDSETTANIGIVKGGKASNVVCASIYALAEARSLSPLKLKEQTEHMENCIRNAAAKFDAKYKFDIKHEYTCYNINENSPALELLSAALETVGINIVKETSGGGSDTNIFNAAGFNTVNISVGMDKVHTTDERIAIKDMTDAVGVLIALIMQASKRRNAGVNI